VVPDASEVPVKVVVAADAEFAAIEVEPEMRVHAYVYGEVPPVAVTVVLAVVSGVPVPEVESEEGDAAAFRAVEMVAAAAASPAAGLG
jgi:hypothetical protein